MTVKISQRMGSLLGYVTFILTLTYLCCLQVTQSATPSPELCDVNLWYVDMVSDGVFDGDLSEQQQAIKTRIENLIAKSRGTAQAGRISCSTLRTFENILLPEGAKEDTDDSKGDTDNSKNTGNEDVRASDHGNERSSGTKGFTEGSKDGTTGARIISEDRKGGIEGDADTEGEKMNNGKHNKAGENKEKNEEEEEMLDSDDRVFVLSPKGLMEVDNTKQTKDRHTPERPASKLPSAEPPSENSRKEKEEEEGGLDEDDHGFMLSPEGLVPADNKKQTKGKHDADDRASKIPSARLSSENDKKQTEEEDITDSDDEAGFVLSPTGLLPADSMKEELDSDGHSPDNTNQQKEEDSFEEDSFDSDDRGFMLSPEGLVPLENVKQKEKDMEVSDKSTHRLSPADLLLEGSGSSGKKLGADKDLPTEKSEANTANDDANADAGVVSETDKVDAPETDDTDLSDDWPSSQLNDKSSSQSNGSQDKHGDNIHKSEPPVPDSEQKENVIETIKTGVQRPKIMLFACPVDRNVCSVFEHIAGALVQMETPVYANENKATVKSEWTLYHKCTFSEATMYPVCPTVCSVYYILQPRGAATDPFSPIVSSKQISGESGGGKLDTEELDKGELQSCNTPIQAHHCDSKFSCSLQCFYISDKQQCLPHYHLPNFTKDQPTIPSGRITRNEEEGSVNREEWSTASENRRRSAGDEGDVKRHGTAVPSTNHANNYRDYKPYGPAVPFTHLTGGRSTAPSSQKRGGRSEASRAEERTAKQTGESESQMPREDRIEFGTEGTREIDVTGNEAEKPAQEEKQVIDEQHKVHDTAGMFPAGHITGTQGREMSRERETEYIGQDKESDQVKKEGLNKDISQNEKTSDRDKTEQNDYVSDVTKEQILDLDRRPEGQTDTEKHTEKDQKYRGLTEAQLRNLEYMLDERTAEQAAKIQTLENTIMRLENHILNQRVREQDETMNFVRLENQILRLENELLRLNQSYAELHAENELLKSRQTKYLALEHKLNGSGARGEDTDSSALSNNISSYMQLVSTQQDRLSLLTQQLRNQSQSLHYLQSRADKLEEQNQVLHQTVVHQREILDHIMQKLQAVSEETLQNRQETTALQSRVAAQSALPDVVTKVEHLLLEVSSRVNGHLPHSRPDLRHFSHILKFFPGDTLIASILQEIKCARSKSTQLCLFNTIILSVCPPLRTFSWGKCTQFSTEIPLNNLHPGLESSTETKMQQQNGIPQAPFTTVNSDSRVTDTVQQNVHKQKPSAAESDSADPSEQLMRPGLDSANEGIVRTNTDTTKDTPDLPSASAQAESASKHEERVDRESLQSSTNQQLKVADSQKTDAVLPNAVDALTEETEKYETSRTNSEPTHQKEEGTAEEESREQSQSPTIQIEDDMTRAENSHSKHDDGQAKDQSHKKEQNVDAPTTGVGNAQADTTQNKDSLQGSKKKADVAEEKKKQELEEAKKEQDMLQAELMARKLKEAEDRNILYKSTDNRRPKDCYDIYKRTQAQTRNGAYKVYVAGLEMYVTVYCDMRAGGWTVILKREDGALDFYKGWNEYKEGFGAPFSEHYVGNEVVHYLTNQDHYSLKVDLKDWAGETRTANYTHFWIDSEDEDFRLHVLGYSGNAGDGLGKHDGMKFSTYDMDNDLLDTQMGGSCAKRFHGAGWYYKCYMSNLMGVHYVDGVVPAKQFDGVAWKPWRGPNYSMKEVVMMIRPKGVR